MKYCKKCDKEVSENFKHCPDCGSKLSDMVREIVKEELDKKHSGKVIEFDLFAKKTIFSIIVVAAAIIALGFVLANPTGLFSQITPTTTTPTSLTTQTTITSIPATPTSLTTQTTTSSSSSTTTIPYVDISVKTVNEYTNEPIADADVYLDGSIACKTGQDGACIIKNTLKGSHNLEATYKGISSKISIDVSPTINFNVKIKAPVDVMLTVKDTETNNFVKATKISLEDRNGKSIVTDTTTQEGTVLVKDIIPAEYRLSVYIPDEQGLTTSWPSQYKSIGFEKQATIEVDMPNPDLKVSVTTHQNFWHTEFYCDITVTNNGNYVSKVPMAICALYEKDNINISKPVSFVGSSTALFRDIAANGGSEMVETPKINKAWNPVTSQDVVVIIYDSNPYGPDRTQDVAMQTSQNFGARVVSDTYAYCSSNQEKCIKLGASFVSDIIKSFFGK